VYVQVPDLAAHIKKAQSLGGKQIVPPTDVPGMGQFAWIADPEGTIVGLWKPAQK
jgi:predicted enzyme related to lactoylglutathione lyase